MKMGNGRVVENIFPDKKVIVHEKVIIFKKLVRSDSKEKFDFKKHYQKYYFSYLYNFFHKKNAFFIRHD